MSMKRSLLPPPRTPLLPLLRRRRGRRGLLLVRATGAATGARTGAA
jgi:hypothetical protein